MLFRTSDLPPQVTNFGPDPAQADQMEAKKWPGFGAGLVQGLKKWSKNESFFDHF